MKCNKCGYDWGDSGDSAHVCGVVAIKKQWVGLTDEEIDATLIDLMRQNKSGAVTISRAIEAKLKEKNT